jgi:hypothetical protein
MIPHHAAKSKKFRRFNARILYNGEMRTLLYAVYLGGFPGAIALALFVISDLPAGSLKSLIVLVVFVTTGSSAAWHSGKALGRIRGGFFNGDDYCPASDGTGIFPRGR